jgi:hypothetical protein
MREFVKVLEKVHLPNASESTRFLERDEQPEKAMLSMQDNAEAGSNVMAIRDSHSAKQP